MLVRVKIWRKGQLEIDLIWTACVHCGSMWPNHLIFSVSHLLLFLHFLARCIASWGDICMLTFFSALVMYEYRHFQVKIFRCINMAVPFSPEELTDPFWLLQRFLTVLFSNRKLRSVNSQIVLFVLLISEVRSPPALQERWETGPLVVFNERCFTASFTGSIESISVFFSLKSLKICCQKWERWMCLYWQQVS